MTPTRVPADAELASSDLSYDAFLAALTGKQVGVDIETTGLEWNFDRIATVQLHIPHYGTCVVRSPSDQPARLAEVIESPKILRSFITLLSIFGSW